MICEKCGKSNIRDLSECAYCGSKMPKTSESAGFSDILSYAVIENVARADKLDYAKEKSMEGVREADMQKLIKKSDHIIKSTKANSLFGVIAIGLCVLILISSIIFGIVTIHVVKHQQAEIMKQIEEINLSVDERMAQVEERFAQATVAEENVQDAVLEEDAATDDKTTADKNNNSNKSVAQ